MLSRGSPDARWKMYGGSAGTVGSLARKLCSTPGRTTSASMPACERSQAAVVCEPAVTARARRSERRKASARTTSLAKRRASVTVGDVAGIAQASRRLDDLRAEVRARIAADRDVIELPRADPGVLQAPRRRERREAGDVLDAAEPFLLRGRDELAVEDEGGRGVTVVGVQTEDRRHGCLMLVIRAAPFSS